LTKPFIFAIIRVEVRTLQREIICIVSYIGAMLASLLLSVVAWLRFLNLLSVEAAAAIPHSNYVTLLWGTGFVGVIFTITFGSLAQALLVWARRGKENDG
jgi:CHASE2 domain-containing sensor protein